jgi:hypothetical protein
MASLKRWWCCLKFLLLDEANIQQEEDQTNTKDNIPPIEEATERKPYGLIIFYN